MILLMMVFHYHEIGYTELYFEYPSSIPSRVLMGEYHNISFVIHNLENRDLNYTYMIITQSDEAREIIRENNRLLVTD
ncbi:MAG: hypothetical protein ABH879_08795, partial [archaeon]